MGSELRKQLALGAAGEFWPQAPGTASGPPGRRVWAIHGHMADRIGVVPAVRGTACCHATCPPSSVEGAFDLPVGDVVLAVDAVGIDGKQHGDAVPSPPGDLGGCGPGIQPQGQGSVPQVVGAAGESGRGCHRPKGLGAGSVPGAAVAAFAEQAAASTAEQSAIRRGAVAAKMMAEHGDQDRWYGDGPDRSVRAVLEAALFVAGSGAGPRCRGAGRGSGQGQRPPAVSGQVAVGETQGDGFFRAQRAVVQAAEERREVRSDPGYGGEQGLGLPGGWLRLSGRWR
jgi:hypothetical protein